MKKLSLYSAALLITCQISANAMDAIAMEQETETGRDGTTPMSDILEPNSPIAADAVVMKDKSDLEKTNQLMQDIFRLSRLMTLAGMEPDHQIEPHALIKELKGKELLAEAGQALEIFLQLPTGETDQHLNSKIVTIIMNKEFHQSPFAIDFARKVHGFWPNLTSDATEKRTAVALFLFTKDPQLVELASEELRSDFFLEGFSQWPCEEALGALIATNQEAIAISYIESVRDHKSNAGNDFKDTCLRAVAEKLNPTLLPVLEQDE